MGTRLVELRVVVEAGLRGSALGLGVGLGLGSVAVNQFHQVVGVGGSDQSGLVLLGHRQTRGIDHIHSAINSIG